jgi:hypothetical protein
MKMSFQFNKTMWAKAFCLYDGSNGGISYRVTLKDGTEIKSGNWSNTYDQDGTWIIPYTKPRIEKEVKQVRGKRGR